MQGWIKLHRGLTNWEWINSHKHLALFTHLLLRSNHKKTKWRGKTIDAGQLLTGRKQLSLWTGLSEQNIRTVLKDLKSTNEITIESFSQHSIITILNWKTYQQSTNEPTSKLTSVQPASNQQVTTSKNVKNVNNVKEVKKKKATAAFINKLDSEIQAWLGKVTQRTIDKWVNEYSEDLILKEINKAYDWNSESGKKVKSVGSFISNWLGRCEKDKSIASQVFALIEESGGVIDYTT